MNTKIKLNAKDLKILESIDVSTLSFDNDRTTIAAYLPDNEDQFIHIGSCEEFEEFIIDTEDVKDYVMYRSIDSSDGDRSTWYHEDMMSDFEKSEYYIKFFKYMKERGLLKLFDLVLNYEAQKQ